MLSEGDNREAYKRRMWIMSWNFKSDPDGLSPDSQTFPINIVKGVAPSAIANRERLSPVHLQGTPFPIEIGKAFPIEIGKAFPIRIGKASFYAELRPSPDFNPQKVIQHPRRFDGSERTNQQGPVRP